MQTLFAGLLFFLLNLSLTLQVQAQALRCDSIFQAGNPSFVSSEGFNELRLDAFTNWQSAQGHHFTADLGTERVFLKRLRKSSLHEAWLMKRINQLGLGVQMLGVLREKEQIFMVLENAPGINTQVPMIAPEKFRMTGEMVSEIRRQAGLLAMNGIIPVDLQFQISTEANRPIAQRIRLMDPELFRVAESIPEAQAATAKIVQNILSNWSMEGKLGEPEL